MGCENWHKPCHEGTLSFESYQKFEELPPFDIISYFFVFQVEKAHDADLHCVDWNPHDDNLILTGYGEIHTNK